MADNELFAGPKRGRPTPGFSIFIRSDGPSDRPTEQDSFVSLDQILVHTHSLGTKGQKDRGTKGQRDNRTKGQKDKGTKGQRD